MILSFVLSLIITLVVPTPISAVSPTATPSSQATSSAQNSETNTISEDIQKIREAVKLKVQEKLKNITSDTNPSDPESSKKAILGTIIQIDKDNLTIDYKNSTRKINFSSDTVIINSKKVKAKLDALKVGQDILAMGYLTNNVLDAKRIVFMDIKSIETQEEIVVGKIVDISKSSPILVLIPSKNKNSQYQIKTDSKTEVINKANQKFDIKKLVSGQKVIVILHPDPKSAKTYIATKIINIETASTASPSATPTSTKTQ